MKADERYFLLACAAEQDWSAYKKADKRFPRALAAALGIAPKRADYLCEKWSRANWYDYGVSVDLGWLAQPGIDAARAALTAQEGES